MKEGGGAKGVGGRENGAGKGGPTAIRLNCNPSPLPSPFSRYSTSHLQRRVASADPAVLCNYLKTFWLPCARLSSTRARARTLYTTRSSITVHTSERDELFRNFCVCNATLRVRDLMSRAAPRELCKMGAIII